MTSRFSSRAASPAAPARALDSITPDDGADLPGGTTRGLFVGRAGAVRVADSRGVLATVLSADSQYHPIEVRRVLATGTTAGDIIALY